jgi:DNA primase
MADDFAQLVKQQADIVRVIGDYLKLRKTGAQNFTGLCPFHKEKTGSFSVNATHGYYYCFGCHEKGDVFNFVMKMESLSFPEAVRAVAQKAGIPLPKREFNSPEEAREAGLRRQLIDIHEAATQYFEAQLKSPEAARAREYLSGRGVSPETVKIFRIGYAPDDFNAMRDALRGHFAEEVLRASGLFSAKDQADGSPGNMYARFRKRITFPIANEAGKIIAFTARALDTTDDKGREVAKYLNSPESALYTKGHVLFNLDKAKSEMRKSDFAVLVEGQMDCISVYMAGVHNVVATSGTAFTETQVRLLGRFTKRVIVNFDPDTAGATSADKSVEPLNAEGFRSERTYIPGTMIRDSFDIKIAVLPGGLDPDGFIRQLGVKAYTDELRQARRYSDHLIERARNMFPPNSAANKVKAMNFLLPHIRNAGDPIHRAEFAENAAQKLGIDSALMRQELKQAAAQRTASIPAHRSEPLTETERILLRALVLPDHASRDLVDARAKAVSALVEHPEWIADLATADLLDRLANTPAPPNPLDAASNEESRAHLALALDHSPQPTDHSLTEQVQGALHNLEHRRLERRQRELRTQIAEADRRGDQDMLTQLIADKVHIDRQLRSH